MDYLQKNTQNPPTVIFLDFNIPRRNGFECLRQIKSDNSLKNIPVIIYSTFADDSVANELYKVGAHYYIRKTNPVSHILSVLDLLAQARLTRPSRDRFILPVGQHGFSSQEFN